jgi:hypothetical protein
LVGPAIRRRIVAGLDFEAWYRETRPVAIGLGQLHPWEFARYTVAEVEMRLAGVLVEQPERARDLLAWLALHTTEYKEGTTIVDLLHREPLPLDPRFQEPDPDAGLTDEELEQLADDEADARIAIMRNAGYPTGRVTPEAYQQMLRESRVL